MRTFLVAVLFSFAAQAAHAAAYDIQCTTTCTAADGTSHASGTVLNIISWCGDQASCPYTPSDGAGAINDVALVADPQGTGQGQLYQAPTVIQPVAAQSEFDCAVVASGTCALPAGTGLSQWTGSGTIAAYTAILPPNPIVGPQSLLQINLVSAFTVTALTIRSGSATIATPSVTGPKVYRLEYTNSGWEVLPN